MEVIAREKEAEQEQKGRRKEKDEEWKRMAANG
jgi:hypothetical protein